MTDADIEVLDDFWRCVSRWEGLIRQYGHTLDAGWEEKWNSELDDAYASIRPLLQPVSRRRMFHDLPMGLNAFDAENHHDALVRLINPPERWFGQIQILDTPEDVDLKKQAEREELAIQDKGGTRVDDDSLPSVIPIA